MIALALLAQAAVITQDDAAIIVTAQRRDQPLLQVPASVSSVSATQLGRLRIQTLEDLAPYTPGFFADALPSRSPDLVLRGISTDVPEVTAEPRVSVFQDGVSFSRKMQSVFELYDLKRIEVVRGPQSTLFGRAALIGAINILRNPADPSAFAASAEAEIGSYSHRRIDAMINMPAGERAALRLAGRIRRDEGYTANLLDGDRLDGQRSAAGRASLHLEPGEAVTADIILSHEHDRYGGQAVHSTVFQPTDPATGLALGRVNRDGAVTLRATDGFAGGRALGGARNLSDATILIGADLGALTLSSISGYVRLASRDAIDVDAVALSLITSGDRSRGDQASEELRLRYDDGGRIGATLGASYFYENQRKAVPLSLDERELLGLLTGVIDRSTPQLRAESFYQSPAVVAGQLQGLARSYGVTLPSSQALAIASNMGVEPESYRRGSRVHSFDGYGDLSFRPADRIEIQAGARLSFDDKTSSFAAQATRRSILASFLGAMSQPAASRSALLALLAQPDAATRAPSASYPLPLIGLFTQATATADGDDGRLKDHGLSWRLTARYALGDHGSAYAVYSRGRRPEILSATSPTRPGGAAQFTGLAGETVDSFELGYRFARPGLLFSAAAYDYRYRHFQTQIQQGIIFIDTDAGRASTYGVEMEGRWTPTGHVELFGAYGYTHARFGTGLYEGNHFRLTPDHSLSLGARWSTALWGGEASVMPVYRWRSRLFFDDSNGNPALLTGIFVTPPAFPGSQGPVGLVDLNGAYRHGATAVALRVHNLFDRRYLRDGGGDALYIGLPSTRPGAPRTMAVSVSHAF